MTIELRPLGVVCNIQCQYCYQNPQRDAGNLNRRYDMDEMKSKLREGGRAFSLFGGEPLMVPEQDLEELWAFGLENFGSNGIQTNGTLINETHIRLFKQYKVRVGISVDGPGELNDVRWHGSLEATRKATAKTHAAIERLCEEGIPPSLIITLHRNNATADKLPLMHQWFHRLVASGVTSVRLHLLEVDHDAVGKKYLLDDKESVAALLTFAELERQLPSLHLDVFKDMRNLLLGKDEGATCVWTGCDPYTTPAVQGIEGSGQSSNCGRTNKDGVDFTKASSEGFERYVALYHTPWEHGGCQGCRFFLMCKGQCPGTSIDGDWRNRSAQCGVWMRLFEHLEEQFLDQGVVPLSVSPKRSKVEQIILTHWMSGKGCSVNWALRTLDKQRRPHSIAPGRKAECSDIHADVPHTDQWDYSSTAAGNSRSSPPPKTV